MTSDDLYAELLAMKETSGKSTFDSTDILRFGDVQPLLEQLQTQGKIVLHNDVCESFEVTG
ncbi:MAG: hypothetical protein MJZ17_11410 [Bacteroidales bacterium]|nr:hypothetical protein [Bacteroidales bacterium]